nr:gamma-glutamyl-gamma-aminobutyrate hydrolase family protein [Micromonospora sp. DSM 115978]
YRADRPPRVMQNANYLSALERAGAVPLPIPPFADHDKVLELASRCDALLLPGGKDVDPSSYGQPLDPRCGVEALPELDAVELRLAEWAVAGDVPLLGVCRGLQILNVALGGSLWQDLDVETGTGGHRADGDDPAVTTTRHLVDVVAGTSLGRLLREPCIEVNSRHHQAVRELGTGLRVSARAGDGVVEEFELPEHRFALAVQWHPEEMSDWHADRLFDALVHAAGRG